MAAYRTLIEAINRRGQFGDDNRRNPLWALMFQHDWQCRSGRLGAGSQHEDGTDRPERTLGVWELRPLCDSVARRRRKRARPDLRSSRHPNRRGSTIGPSRSGTGIEDWRRFFTAADTTDPGDDEPVRLALWKAHKTCLDVVAHHLGSIDPGTDSPTELAFLRGWCRMVDYLWAAAWPTDFDFTVTHGLGVLPDHLLEDGPGRPDLSRREARNVRTVTALDGTPAWRHRINLALWRRAMRTRQARDDVLVMLDAIFNPNPGNAAARRRLLGYLLRP